MDIPPNWGGHEKKSESKTGVFQNGGGKFGGDIPPNCGGNLTCPPQAILKISPPNDVFWGGQRGLWVWRGNRSKFSMPPPQRNAVWRGHLSIFPPQTWRGQPIFSASPSTLKGVSPPLLRWWGGTLCPPQTWGGHLGGTDFALGGNFTSPSPPIGGEMSNYALVLDRQFK